MAQGWHFDADRHHGGAGCGLHPAVLHRRLGLEFADMTESQVLILVGTLWVAPHVPAPAGLLGGILILIAACLKGLGWV